MEATTQTGPVALACGGRVVVLEVQHRGRYRRPGLASGCEETGGYLPNSHILPYSLWLVKAMGRYLIRDESVMDAKVIPTSAQPTPQDGAGGYAVSAGADELGMSPGVSCARK